MVMMMMMMIMIVSVIMGGRLDVVDLVTWDIVVILHLQFSDVQVLTDPGVHQSLFLVIPDLDSLDHLQQPRLGLSLGVGGPKRKREN